METTLVPNKRAVIYCRVSTKEQVEEGNSLITQEKNCREYALRTGYEIAEKFIEKGESAKTQNRPELQRLLSYCSSKKNGINAVIAYKIDRISRNIDDYSYLRILLKRYGVEIKSTTEHFENNPAGRFMENIIANVAQFDNDVRTERSVGGMRDAMREGRYVWKAPIGYNNGKIADKSNLVPNSDAKLILKLFESISQNIRPLDEVRILLSKEGLMNKKGNPVTKSYFYQLIKNETYAGWIIKFGERHKGVYEPIVSQELFDRVQYVINRRKHKGFRYLTDNPDFPLRRFVKHPTGLALSGAWAQGRKKKYAYYRFFTPHMLFPKAGMERAFMDFFNQFVFDSNSYEQLLQFVKKHLIKSTEDEYLKIQQRQKHIAELKEKQNALVQKNLDGVISDGVLRQQLENIESQLMSIYAEPQAIYAKRVNFQQLLNFVRNFLENPGSVWANTSFMNKLKLQWFVFPQGLTFDGEKLRTAEVFSIYKAKEAFWTSQSSKVDFNSNITNTPEIANSINALILKEKIGNELIGLAEILADMPIAANHYK